MLIFSVIFYGFGGIRFLILLSASIIVNYIGGLIVGISSKTPVRRIILITVIIINLGLLGVFKYAGFVTSSLAAIGLPVSIAKITLPIGISFFTFQGLSYVIDVYRRDAGVQKNPLYVALYISLFPQLVAGPIVRYTDIERELSQRSVNSVQLADGAVRFMLGFGKKMLLANAMGEIADTVFAHSGTELLTIPLAWVGAIAYTFQIYFDFSAYSDMAIGLGEIFGFHFNENFNYPYISVSITDFWRRWHISLSTWFRDYVYIPLGGNRVSASRHIFNIAVVWFLTGLWHGAAWTFVLWGVYYGILLILEKYVFARLLLKIPSVMRHILTLILVILGWVLFRSETIGGAVDYIAVMFGASNASASEAVYLLRQYLPEFVLCLIAIFPIKRLFESMFKKHEDNKTMFSLGVILPKVFALVVFTLSYMKLVSGGFNPFIYFQF